MTNETAEVMAEKAYGLCQQAYKSKDIDLARIYILNALTHNTELRYLKALETIVKKTPLGNRKEIAQQALNMFSMALFQAPADQVCEIRNLIDSMQGIYDDSFAFNGSESASEMPATTTWNELLDDYSWFALRQSGCIEDMAKIQQKGSYLQKLIDAGELSESMRVRVEREFKMTVSYLDFLSKKEALESTILDIEAELKSRCNLHYLVAKLQNASAVLAQLWLLDVADVIPNEQFRNVLSEYADKIERFEHDCLKLKGMSLYKSLKDRITTAVRSGYDGKTRMTLTIKNWQKLIQDVSSRISEVQDSEQVGEIQMQLQKLGEALEKLSQRRYAEYQAFSAAKCRAAIKSFDNASSVSSADAMKYLDRWELAKIDESLLSPEAAGMFHEAKGMLVDKLSRTERADFQVKCVTSEKFKLEDF